MYVDFYARMHFELITSVPKKLNIQFRKFPKAVTFALYLFGVMAVSFV